MSSRFASAFDELLEQSRRELDALYRDAAPAGPSRSASSSAPPSEPPPPAAPAQGANHPAAPVERLLDERYGDGWRFEITSRRREGNEAIVVGALRLPGTDGGARAQFGSAPIAAPGGGVSGSVGNVGFSSGGGGFREDPRAAEEAAFERARLDALGNCAATTRDLKEA